MERGAAPDNGAAVERREAPPPALLGAERLASVPGGPRQCSPKGGLAKPSWRLPALHPLARRGKEKGERTRPRP